MKVMIVKEVMAGDISPVAMFSKKKCNFYHKKFWDKKLEPSQTANAQMNRC
jgi:hypothetical protein